MNHRERFRATMVCDVKYAIITNPVSGKMTVDQKRLKLAKAAGILNAEIHGLDAINTNDFIQYGQELARRCDVLVVAGGDGTLSDIINSIDTAKTPIAYLPLGTGNAMQSALRYKGSLADIAMRIKNVEIHEYDLVSCSEKRRAYIASVGIEGQIIQLRDQYLPQGLTGFKAYFKALLKSYFREYKPTAAKIVIDKVVFEVKNLLSLMVVKQPYYGFGMKVVPRACFDDGHLHILCITSGFFKFIFGVATSFTIGNRVGHYLTGQHVTVSSERFMVLLIDGNEGWEANAFTFRALPNALKIKC